MTTYAFRRAKSVAAIGLSLHPEFIIEYADTALFDEGFHKAEDGYEFLNSTEFHAELARNPERLEEFESERKAADKARLEAEAIANAKRAAEERKAQKEYQEFLQWKKMKGAK